MESVVDRIKDKWKKEYTSKVDVDLEFGESFEYSLAEVLTMGKIEVKTERDKWKKTGNIAIELMNQGNKSGLSVTEAEWWAHILSYKNRIESVILIPVPKLKRLVKKLVQENKALLTMGGDDNVKLNGKEVGLFPVFNVRGPHGRFPQNHQEYIVKELGDKNETFGI